MFEENLDEFLDEKEGFASFASVYFADGGQASLKGILTSNIDESAAGVLGSISSFECAGSAAESVKEGDRIVIEDISYLVRNIKDDGSGWLAFDLERL